MLEIDDYVKRIIHTKALLLVGRCGITVSDIDDIKQELYLEVLVKSHLFDQDKATASTFLQCILENKISEILIYKTLGLVCKTFTELELTPKSNEFISDDTEQSNTELKIDMQEVIASLNEEMRQACILLGNGVSITDAARLMGINRSTFYTKILKPLSERFNDKSLNLYQ